MNTLQLKELLRGYPVTICASDQLKLQKGRFVISNTDTREGPGKHWVTFYFPHQGPYEFFDSLGNRPRRYGVNFETVLQKPYLMNCDRLQPPYSNACGLYCVYYIINRYNGMNLTKIVNPFNVNALELNDTIVGTFLNNNK